MQVPKIYVLVLWPNETTNEMSFPDSLVQEVPQNHHHGLVRV